MRGSHPLPDQLPGHHTGLHRILCSIPSNNHPQCCHTYTYSLIVDRSTVVGHVLTVHMCSFMCTNHTDMIMSWDMYSAILRHVVCNYMSNPMKYPNLNLYLPSNYKSGKEYVVVSNMHSYKTWGTEVEIIAMAQITRFDILVYTVQGEWVHYKSSTTDNDHTERCFYISNKSGYHFDPVFDC